MSGVLGWGLGILLVAGYLLFLISRFSEKNQSKQFSSSSWHRHDDGTITVRVTRRGLTKTTSQTYRVPPSLPIEEVPRDIRHIVRQARGS